MSEQSIEALSAHMEGAPQLNKLFPWVEREYTRCVTALNCTNIYVLPKSESIGVIGIIWKRISNTNARTGGRPICS